jgi:outer membrane murein-binding lipoprotein Lpp
MSEDTDYNLTPHKTTEEVIAYLFSEIKKMNTTIQKLETKIEDLQNQVDEAYSEASNANSRIDDLK